MRSVKTLNGSGILAAQTPSSFAPWAAVQVVAVCVFGIARAYLEKHLHFLDGIFPDDCGGTFIWSLISGFETFDE